jgi:hypothetical protein
MNARTPFDVDAALRDLAGSLEIPPPPDYAARVLPLLDGAPAGPVVRLHPRRVSRLLLAAAAVLLAALATTVAVPASRHVLTSWFGFSGIEIRTAPSSLIPPPPGPPGPAGLGAGELTTLHHARLLSGGRLALPAGLSAPTDVLADENNGATVITLAYRTAPGLRPTPDTGYALIVTEIFDAGKPVLEKLLHTGSHVSRARIAGSVAVFVRGPQQLITIERDPNASGGEVDREVAPRASANTIMWAAGPVTYRLEADFSRSAAVALAKTVR